MKDKKLLAAVVVVTLVAGGALVASARVTAGKRVASGGSPAARAIVEHSIQSLPDNHVASADFTSPRPDEIESGAPERGDNWLRFGARADSRADAIVADWQAQLVLASYLTAAPKVNAAGVDGSAVVVTDRDGQVIDRNDIDVPPAAHDVRQNPVPARTPAEAAIRAQVERGAAAAGLRVVRTVFVPLPDLSVDVTVATTAPKLFVAQSAAEIYKIFGTESGIDGRLLRVVDSAGNPVLSASYVHLLNSGSLWIAPKYAGASDSYGVPAIQSDR